MIAGFDRAEVSPEDLAQGLRQMVSSLMKRQGTRDDSIDPD
jgi:hypothetical protein